MKNRLRTIVCTFLIFLGFIILILSFWDTLFEKGWMYKILLTYAVLLLATIIFVLLSFKKPKPTNNKIKDFKKSLKGELYHYKCPECKGIFALKKSHSIIHKSFKMNCPDCGRIGIVHTVPLLIEEKIPDKKSMGINYSCKK